MFFSIKFECSTIGAIGSKNLLLNSTVQIVVWFGQPFIFSSFCFFLSAFNNELFSVCLTVEPPRQNDAPPAAPSSSSSHAPHPSSSSRYRERRSRRTHRSGGTRDDRYRSGDPPWRYTVNSFSAVAEEKLLSGQFLSNSFIFDTENVLIRMAKWFPCSDTGLFQRD